MTDDSITIARMFLRLVLAVCAGALVIIFLILACFSGVLPLVIAGVLAGTVAGLLTIPERERP